LKKVNINLPHDPAIPLLGIYPREMKTYVHTKTCSEMFTATLFIIAQNGNTSVHQLWINQMWYTYNGAQMGTRKEQVPDTQYTWMDLGDMLHEKKPVLKTTRGMAPFVGSAHKWTSVETESRWVAFLG
jgi:predicted cupin superfamily sugar epimerase